MPYSPLQGGKAIPYPLGADSFYYKHRHGSNSLVPDGFCQRSGENDSLVKSEFLIDLFQVLIYGQPPLANDPPDIIYDNRHLSHRLYIQFQSVHSL